MRDYQYGTSPRKLETEYEEQPKKRKNKRAKKVQKKSTTSKKQNDKKAEKKSKIKFRIVAGANIIIFFVIAFTIIYRNSLISQSFSQIQTLKTQVSEIQKENDQLEISIQNSLNLSNIEQTAKDLLGMQKLTSKQTVYLSLPKKDYVEASTEEVILEENTSIVSKIMNFLGKIF
jgi:cell division protein FtsL